MSLGFQKENIRFIQKALQADKNSYAFFSAQRLKGSLPVWALGWAGGPAYGELYKTLDYLPLSLQRGQSEPYARKLYERVHSESAAGGQKLLRFSQRAATERLFARLGSHPSQEEPGAIHASARSRARNAASAVGEGTEGSRGSGRETSHRRAVAKRVGSSRG